MRKRLVHLSIGLTLMIGFVACNETDVVATPPGEESTITGTVAFRLSDTVREVVEMTSDSVRIEAVRDGYATKTATGAIGGSTLLANLEPGAWTLKVATFDTMQAVSWYGESTVVVRAGGTTDAVVVLRKAKGSVDVRIELDTLPIATDTIPDTVTVKWIEGNPRQFKALPIEAAWRTEAGIYIATRYDYFFPRVVHNLAQSSLPRRLFLVGDPIVGGSDGTHLEYVGLLPHIVFVPCAATEDFEVATADNATVFKLPGRRIVVVDTSTADTVTVKYTQGDLADHKWIPVDSAWRTDEGIYIATRYDYFTPVVVATPTQTMYPQELTLAGKPISTLVAFRTLRHVVFVPFPSSQGVSITDLLHDTVYRFPAKPVVASDSSFILYMKTVTSNWAGYTDIITLRATGEVFRDLRQRVVDTTATTGKAFLSADTMAMIRKIMEQASIRHPGQVPTITGDCVKDLPIVQRQISYAGGTATTMTSNPSATCGELLPASWKDLDPVDAILDALFAKP